MCSSNSPLKLLSALKTLDCIKAIFTYTWYFFPAGQNPGTPYNTSYASPIGAGNGPGSNQNNSNNGDGYQGGTADFMGPLSHLDNIVNTGADMLPVDRQLNHGHDQVPCHLIVQLKKNVAISIYELNI